jgi:hypothetical protein
MYQLSLIYQRFLFRQNPILNMTLKWFQKLNLKSIYLGLLPL